METALAVVCAVLAVSLVLQYLSHRSTRKQLEEYKTLFEISDQGFKESQGTVENLLRTDRKNSILLERGANALNTANEKLLEQKASLETLTAELEVLKQTTRFQEDQYEKLLSQKKSSEVRTGKITEQLSPFLADYPLNPKTAKFVGDPIDFIHFDDDKITFVEVKSGKSQLNKRQRQIRDLIKEGKVEFTIYRVEGKV